MLLWCRQMEVPTDRAPPQDPSQPMRDWLQWVIEQDRLSGGALGVQGSTSLAHLAHSLVRRDDAGGLVMTVVFMVVWE